MKRQLVSIVIPAYNEEANITDLHKNLIRALPDKWGYEILFVDDGSSDQTYKRIKALRRKDKRVKVVSLSRNFGKEIALTAGIHHARGDAVITIDADGQHPAKLISTFLGLWSAGDKIIIGVRKSNQKEGFVKRYGSLLFYRLFNLFSGAKLTPGSTDFRLLDKEVCEIFKQLPENDRITRGLIDWMGFNPTYVPFHADPRRHGESGYNFRKLVNLALNSFVSLSFAPLFFFGYLGLAITTLSFLTGVFILIEKYLLHDPWHLRFTNPALLAVMIIFLVGIVLMSQGLTALYISRIYTESKGRPIYIINKSNTIL